MTRNIAGLIIVTVLALLAWQIAVTFIKYAVLAVIIIVLYDTWRRSLSKTGS